MSSSDMQVHMQTEHLYLKSAQINNMWKKKTTRGLGEDT